MYVTVITTKEMYRTENVNLFRESWWNNALTANSGVLMIVTYTKLYNTTALRLTANGDHSTEVNDGHTRW